MWSTRKVHASLWLVPHRNFSMPQALSPAGVVENILGRVLDAFQARINSLLGNSLSRGFAENASLALQMAAEPAALLLHDPIAFFVGKASETPDAFQKALAQAGGLGSGDEAAQTAILAQFSQAR